MLKSFKYRLYPNKQQEELLNKHIGCVRFIYNSTLETKQSQYAKDKTNLSWMDLVKLLPALRKEHEWLKEVNSQSLQQSVINMNTAFENFFKGRADFPKFKKKNSSRQSFNIPQNIKIESGKLIIPKFKKGIEVVIDKVHKGSIRQATINRTPTGKYFVSILCETGGQEPELHPIEESKTVGVDLGIKTFIVTSEGKEYENPKYLKKSINKLKYSQRQYSKYKGKRRKQKVAVLNEKITNRRKDFLHKVSTELIRENQSIALEDLNINGMLKNHHLAGSIADASWGMFVTMLEYKAKWDGVNILKIGRFDPSSKTCSCCGFINKELTLGDRKWICPECNSVLDRDLNAAINIKNFALNHHLCTERILKNHGMLPSLEGASTHEVHC